VKFFFDNNLSPHLARALHELIHPDGHEVVHLRAKFAPNTPDTIWIAQLAQEAEWVIVSGDMRIHKHSAEKAVWKSAKLMGFFLAKGWMNITPMDQAWRLIKWWPDVIKQVDIGAPGATYSLGLNPLKKIDTI
jgi:hypothetical protein